MLEIPMLFVNQNIVTRHFLDFWVACASLHLVNGLREVLYKGGHSDPNHSVLQVKHCAMFTVWSSLRSRSDCVFCWSYIVLRVHFQQGSMRLRAEKTLFDVCMWRLRYFLAIQHALLVSIRRPTTSSTLRLSPDGRWAIRPKALLEGGYTILWLPVTLWLTACLVA